MVLERMTFSKSLRSLHGLTFRGEIDTALFDLFLRPGVCAEYAKKFLSAEQCDALDVSACLSPLVPLAATSGI